ncbi:MAG: hypothetical protein ACTS4X_01270 [Candidatus Hodgkinia cicadicola]
MTFVKWRPMFVCTGCSAAGEMKRWEVWVNLFKCTFNAGRLGK